MQKFRVTALLLVGIVGVLSTTLAQQSQNPPSAGNKPSSPASPDNGQGTNTAPPAAGAPNPAGSNVPPKAAPKMDTMNSTAANNGGESIDTLFMMAVSMSNRFEIESSQAALQKNVGGATLTFANKMILEHNKAQTALAALAQKKNISSLPKDSGAQNRMLINNLTLSGGAEFLKGYLTAQLEGHKNTVKIFETEIKLGKDADVKAFAQKNLPTIQMHTQMAAALVASSGKSAGAAMPAMNSSAVGKTGNGTNDAKAGNAAATPQTPNKPAGN